MHIQERLMSSAEFDSFTERPENRDKRFELLQGEVIEVPSPTKHHMLVMLEIYLLLRLYIKTQGIGGTVITDNLDHRLGASNILKPDIGYTSAVREPFIPQFPTIAPDLVVEIVSPSNTLAEFEEKMKVFFEHGTRLIWLVYPKSKTVWVYTPGTSPDKPMIETFSEADTIDGGAVLPGFATKVADFFPTLPLDDDAL